MIAAFLGRSLLSVSHEITRDAAYKSVWLVPSFLQAISLEALREAR